MHFLEEERSVKMGSRTDIKNAARAWVGAIAGDAKHREILDTYNNHRPLARGYKIKPTDAWCAAFVSACAIKSGNADVVPLEVSCPQMVALAQQRGISGATEREKKWNKIL